MIHSTPGDEIIYSDVHEYFIRTEPWGEYKDGHFVGRLVVCDTISTSIDVPIYDFTVESLIEDFFDSHATEDGIFSDEIFIDGDFEYKDESLTMARGIVSDLKRMTARLEAAIAKSEAAALKGGDE